MQEGEIQPGTLIDNKYRIERLLGKGGMGAVYLAMHEGTDRPVALKVIAPQYMLQDEFVARFQREARAAGRLLHPNVVNVTDFGFGETLHGKAAYLVMEYLDGCALSDILEEETKLPLAWTIDILEQACSALEEAHQQGIIHRDLKPDNIWLQPNRRGGHTVKVLDFGLAKLSDAGSSPGELLAQQADASSPGVVTRPNAALTSFPNITLNLTKSAGSDAESATRISPAPISRSEPLAAAEEDHTLMLPANKTAQSEQTADASAIHQTSQTNGLTRVGSVMGTPLYMSPEQCRGETLDARSDIYSLGVIAYQMLAGTTPFKGEMTQVLKQHMETAPPPLRDLQRKVPRRIAAQIMAALSKNPADRPASAAAFASALRAYSEKPGSLVQQALTLFSQHPLTFIRLALIVFAPYIILNLLSSMIGLSAYFDVVADRNSRAFAGVAGGLSGLMLLIMEPVFLAVTARLVTQMLAAPLRPVRLSPAFKSLRQRLWPFIKTTLRAYLKMFVGFLFFAVPGIIFAIQNRFVAPVVMIEGVTGKAALQRSKELVKRSRRLVILVVLIQFLLPIIIDSALSYFLRSIIRDAGVAENMRRAAFGRTMPVISLPTKLLIWIINAILTSLLYLNTRMAGGETIHQTLGLFEEEEMPDTAWQQRMRNRLQLRSSGKTTPARRS